MRLASLAVPGGFQVVHFPLLFTFYCKKSLKVASPAAWRSPVKGKVGFGVRGVCAKFFGCSLERTGLAQLASSAGAARFEILS